MTWFCRRAPRHQAFGWASARVVDGGTLIPARLGEVIDAAVSARPLATLACMGRDGRGVGDAAVGATDL
ncbi:hypothetical protein EEB11_12495 [Pseudotabrizicola sediminis]|uniref:Uncharacterized protein n=1 Tax=Pseudotabrizicola sediminis TaxID=2486418 RepID=A0ABY2KJH8_9RHOB|nr:hypothetical protein [Pseudotabrizicola sediminis]TGD42572.1 hypothetical protein EEB11_12495 [Pseudotabrizicola sediminis]